MLRPSRPRGRRRRHASESAMIAKVAAEMVHTPAARPSTPSVKFTTFMTATSPSRVSGIPQSPKLSGSTNGTVTCSTRTPARTGTSPATICPASLTSGERPSSRASSTAPTTAINPAPPRMARVSSFQGRKIAPASRTPARIASPPRLGVGCSWRLRRFGRSMAPTPCARRAASGVSTSAVTPATRNAQSASRSFIPGAPYWRRRPPPDRRSGVARQAGRPHGPPAVSPARGHSSQLSVGRPAARQAW